MILNLKQLNTNVIVSGSLNVTTNLISQNCFMPSVDLEDAYYSIPVAKPLRKFLRFHFDDQLYQYTCLPNGLSSCPRIFTKLLKSALTYLHKRGHVIAAYLHDIYIQGNTFDECTKALTDTIEVFTRLDFVFLPSKEIKMLGFILNSESMSVRFYAITM